MSLPWNKGENTMDQNVINNALNTIENEIEKDMQDLPNRTNDEWEKSIDQYSDVLKSLNNMADGKFDVDVQCINILNKINEAVDKNDHSLAPTIEELRVAQSYAEKEENIEYAAAFFSALIDLGKMEKDDMAVKVFTVAQIKALTILYLKQDNNVYADLLINSCLSFIELKNATEKEKINWHFHLIVLLEQLVEKDYNKYIVQLIHAYYDNYCRFNTIPMFDVAYILALELKPNDACLNIIDEYRRKYPIKILRNRRKSIAQKARNLSKQEKLMN